MKVSAEQVRWFRLRRSGLVEGFASPEEAASRLVGVQAQILPAAGLALWNRTRGLSHERYESLLYEGRTLVKLWGQRNTLHLYPSAEWGLVHGALSEQQSWWERKIAQRGGDVAAYKQLIARLEVLLRERGTLGRSDLRATDLPLTEWHLSSWGGIFVDLVRHGYACHAPRAGGEGRFAHREHWLPDLEWNPPPVEQANVEIARRYLRTYGPATAQDIAYWRGTKLSQARQWLTTLQNDLIEVTVADQPRFVLKEDLDPLYERLPEREAWPVRMLYRFDPLLLAHKDKSWLVPAEQYKRVWRPAGHIEGTLLEHGHLIGTWRYKRTSRRLTITLSPFAPLPAHVKAAAEQQAQGVADFFGLELDFDMSS